MDIVSWVVAGLNMMVCWKHGSIRCAWALSGVLFGTYVLHKSAWYYRFVRVNIKIQQSGIQKMMSGEHL